MSLFNLARLHNKIVLVTGASAGIGKAAAILFAKAGLAGSNVILVARRAEALQGAVEECQAAHKRWASKPAERRACKQIAFAGVQIDVSKRDQIAGLWNQVPSELRQVDILVNNAGFVFGVERVGEIAESDIDAMFATNVSGLIAVTQLLVKDFKSRQQGHVINLGSIAGREPYAGGSIYCATKHAVRAFTGSLMRELVDTPIRVTEIQPGMVETEFSIVRFRGDKSAADKVYNGLEPLTAEDIAEEIVWSASRPPHVNIAEVFVLPTNQATPTLSYRRS
ncbi:NAD(P)-binding protein [Auriculariales sp. MPI-PUGE-AT-0066]|nr:NAD(P)-binding protein [Auriculariales sp. MPI-PUGE-AT-0066]